MMDNMDSILTMIDEDGNEIEYECVDSIVYENVEYVVLLPVDEEDCEVEILEVQDDGEMENYVAVDDDEVLEEVYKIFKERFKDQLDFDD